MTNQWVVIALAPARSAWVGRLAAWATTGALPLEVVRCQSVAELRARLATTRAASAALVDGDLGGLDRDLLGSTGGCPVIVVGGQRHTSPRHWTDLGAAAVLGEHVDPAELWDLLGLVARPLAAADDVPGDPAGLDDVPLLLGRLVTVCGAGGTGASTAAIALAEGVAQGAGGDWLDTPVVVADLCLHGDLAMLHDARDVLLGVQELVDAHRANRPDAGQVRSHCVPVIERGYEVLLGIRQPRAWTAMRPGAIAAALAGLRAAYGTVVADIEHDVEGEAQTGSIDVEERHAMARTAALAADVVAVVGLPGLHGTHALVRLVRELADVGVQPGRILPVVNRAPRHAGSRAEITRALAELCLTDGGLPAPPVFLPERRIEAAVRSGGPLPRSLTTTITGAVAAVLARTPLAGPAGGRIAPQRVSPGSLGNLADDLPW